MRTHHADQAVTDFVAGRISRRDLITRLMGLGAAAAGMGAGARSALAQQGDPHTFHARSVDHVALRVTDIPRSRDWYSRHLGLTVASESETSCFLDCGDDFLALFRGDTPGLDHFSFAIPNYSQDDAARRLRAAGLTPKLRGGRTYFDDPDGIEVQVSPA